MKIDNYCIGLVLLILFFIFVDNYNNVEGYAGYDIMGADLASVEQGKGLLERGPAPVDAQPSPMREKVQVPSKIGQVPQKLDMKAPPSMGFMEGSLAPVDMGSFMLLEDPSVAGVDVSDSQVPMAYPRVGGVGNLGEAKQASSGSVVELHMVYAPWCGWSKKAMPDYEKFEKEFNGKQVGSCMVKVMKHDSETEEGKAFAKANGVRGFPTHFFMKDGVKTDAKGRSFDELSKQLKGMCA